MNIRTALFSFLMLTAVMAPAQAKVSWRHLQAPVVGVLSAGVASAVTFALMKWWHKVQLHRIQEEMMMQERLDRVVERHQLDEARQQIKALKSTLQRLGHDGIVVPQQAAPIEAQLLDKALENSGTK